MAIPAYEFYTGVFHGEGIPKGDWDRLATRADEEIMRLERAYTVADPTGDGRDKAVCAIADRLNDAERREDMTVSIGSVSTSRKSGGGADVSGTGLFRLAQVYLDIYRGVRYAH
ncbi:MAG: hypothetical protein LBR76_01705 [Oscillospiraceae bacterium]|jgi:hypothetical protein|nr:hypothetical protein [Oscillospiraceae bacterium]